MNAIIEMGFRSFVLFALAILFCVVAWRKRSGSSCALLVCIARMQLLSAATFALWDMHEAIYFFVHAVGDGGLYKSVVRTPLLACAMSLPEVAWIAVATWRADRRKLKTRHVFRNAEM